MAQGSFKIVLVHYTLTRKQVALNSVVRAISEQAGIGLGCKLMRQTFFIVHEEYFSMGRKSCGIRGPHLTRHVKGLRD